VRLHLHSLPLLGNNKATTIGLGDYGPGDDDMLATCAIAFLGIALVAQYQGSCDTGIRGLTDIFFNAETPLGGWRLPGDPEPSDRLGLAIAASTASGATRVARRAKAALPESSRDTSGKEKTMRMLAGGEKLRVTAESFVINDPEAAAAVVQKMKDRASAELNGNSTLDFAGDTAEQTKKDTELSIEVDDGNEVRDSFEGKIAMLTEYALIPW